MLHPQKPTEGEEEMTLSRLRSKTAGFTLIELLVVIAIIGILAAVAVPSYLDYAKRAKYSEVVNATAPFKVAVEACYITRGNLTDCDSGFYGVPAAITGGDGHLNDLAVADGVITADGDSATFGPATGAEYTFILTPSIPGTAGKGASLTWAASGTCQGVGLCQ
jgi:type IV pilus assembly protein PilA